MERNRASGIYDLLGKTVPLAIENTSGISKHGFLIQALARPWNIRYRAGLSDDGCNNVATGTSELRVTKRCQLVFLGALQRTGFFAYVAILLSLMFVVSV